MGKEGTLSQIPLIKGSKRAAFLPGEKKTEIHREVSKAIKMVVSIIAVCSIHK